MQTTSKNDIATMRFNQRMRCSRSKFRLLLHVWLKLQTQCNASRQARRWLRSGSARQTRTARQLDIVGSAEQDKVYDEKQSAVSRDGRTALAEMIGYVRDGDTVVVASMNRMARFVVELNQIVKEAGRQGCLVAFLKESISFRPGDAAGASESPRARCQAAGRGVATLSGRPPSQHHRYGHLGKRQRARARVALIAAKSANSGAKDRVGPGIST